MSLLSALLDLIFPAKCPFAAVFWTDRASVAPVAGSFPGRREPTPCAGGPAGFLCAAPLWYQGLAREGLHRFKFRGMSSAAATLGELIAGARRSTSPERSTR